MNLNPQPLFNKTVIEKLCSKIKLTDLQKQSALTWIKKIENNELRDEQKRQNLFEKYILMQILGYDLEELPREDLEIDYTMEIPGFQKSMCMEVKGTKTKDLFKDQKRKDDSKYNPVIQLYTYMSHGFDYGVVSNYKDFIFSYNYSYQQGDIKFGSGGFHQITLGFNFLRGAIDCDCF